MTENVRLGKVFEFLQGSDDIILRTNSVFKRKVRLFVFFQKQSDVTTMHVVCSQYSVYQVTKILYNVIVRT